ncbi:surfeit locus protein 6-domain-containing protein [Stachybotrys elegans]|uniref:Surfeit locus protein 6-domain-containing protein n=1 Tax=Stachybotrys elegans TaxID=80388 RepID=A0A8K0WW41_9HYPO|nr:surfeit locus protein 6-domain-containing protein [Stachybotrys elegans]
MGDASLRDRLRDHAEAFDGLLSLIPAKMYYGEDTSDQWQRKKQTKAEAAAARRGKLDPDSELNRNAKEVMDERAKNKRKLRELEAENQDDDDDFEPAEGVDVEKPGEGLKKKAAEANKKQKLGETDAPGESQTVKLSKKEEKRAAKREKKKEKKAEKIPSKTPNQPTPDNTTEAAEEAAETPAPKPTKSQKQKKSFLGEEPESVPEKEPKRQTDKGEMRSINISNLEKDADDTNASASHSEPQSPTFDLGSEPQNPPDASAEPASTTTSVSSTIPPSEKPKHIKIPANTEALRARLAAKIEALRAARKADGPDGKPIRTRQELIESRRAKEAQRKAHKKELRRQAKLEEDRKREEALASNSPSVMSPVVEMDETGNFSFGRVAFGDGAQLSHDLSYVLNQGKKKGPSDPKTALLKFQNQKKRVEEMDDEKRKEIEEKEAWLTARRRAEGERIRDDENMLKKAVKRKEVSKKKSEKAWKERAQGVENAQKARQRKREENIKKRREDKLLGKAGKKKKKAGGAKKKGGRPGFEGSLGVGGRRK